MNSTLLLAATALFLASAACRTPVPPSPPPEPGPPETEVTVDLPRQVHVTWQGDPATSFTVTWETSAATPGSWVRCWIGDAPERRVSGTSFGEGSSGLTHVVDVTGLQPQTACQYRCGDAAGGWSAPATVVTAPVGQADLVFTSGGDSRNNLDEWKLIVSRMLDQHPAFTLFAGDLLASGDDLPGYDTWFLNWEPLGRQAAIAPVLGNHEQGGLIYLQRFVLPPPERWYSFTYGPVHVTAISSENNFLPGSEQYQWLRGDLAAAAADPSQPWLIVLLHKPVYSSQRPSYFLQNVLAPLFDEYGIDLVIAGHNHFYERSYPLRAGADPQHPQVMDYGSDDYRRKAGTIHLVTGSVGAPLYENVPAPFIVFGRSAYHFARIEIKRNGPLQVQAYLDDGKTVIDSFRINR